MTRTVLEPRVMRDPREILTFATAGAAVLTLSSGVSGVHYTFRIAQQKEGKKLWFVSLLTGSDDFTYLGVLDHLSEPIVFRLTAKSKMEESSTPVKAFRWFVQHVLRDGRIPDHLEVRHEGKCGRCGRALTHPLSIDRGIGPDCWEIMGLGMADVPNFLRAG